MVCHIDSKVKCPNCGARWDTVVRYCPSCGVRQQVDSSYTYDTLKETEAELETWSAPSSPPAPLASPDRLEPGSILAQRYRILSQVGSGGMATVYKAYDLELEEVVAVKAMLPAFWHDEQQLANLKQEIRLARKISHENVCHIFELGLSGELRFAIMEYIAGVPLDRYLKERALPLQQKIDILQGVTEGLQAAHCKKIVHRDLKPSNILISKERGPVILDFGLACHSDPKKGKASNGYGVFAGTPLYMAPEQILGQAVSPQTDIYSLGVIAYEMFTGAPPFAARSTAALTADHLFSLPPSPQSLAPEIPLLLEELILQMLQKKQEDRFSSVVEIKQILQKLHKPNQRTILVAEDDPYVRLMLERCLVRAGYQVSLAPNGHEALERAMTILPDLICLDINMPQLDGLRVAEILKQQKATSPIPILILTGLDHPQYPAYCDDVGVDAFLNKPFEPQQLLQQIERCLSPHRAPSAETN